MTKSRDTRKDQPVSGFLGGLGSFVQSLGDLVETIQKSGGSITREGEIPLSGSLGETKAVYGFTFRTASGGRETRVEPFGNLGRGPAGEPVVTEYREPLIDVFDESDHILLVAELPGIQESEIRIEVEGDHLTLTADGDRQRFRKSVTLSTPISTWTSNYQNGILELRLTRTGDSPTGQPPRPRKASPKKPRTRRS